MIEILGKNEMDTIGMEEEVMATKDKILEMLQQQDSFVSGQTLCDQLGISRTAVWKNMNALKEDGYVIESVNNKGYHLVEEPDVIDPKRIGEYLHTQWLAHNIVYDKKMDSTNTQAKILGESGGDNGTVVIAEQQTAGKGRRGKTWVSPMGNCYFTVLLRPDVHAERASMITLVSALALAQAVENVMGLRTMIKWPNDVIANGKKLCGILTESSSDLEYINYVVVGIGVNCNQTEFPEEIRDIASSICLETGKKVDRTRLLAEFFNCFEVYYEKFLETEDLQGLVADYNARLINRGKDVKIVEKEQETVLRAIGVDQRGGLIVEDKAGVQRSIISGEVSVRGLYGYV